MDIQEIIERYDNVRMGMKYSANAADSQLAFVNAAVDEFFNCDFAYNGLLRLYKQKSDAAGQNQGVVKVARDTLMLQQIAKNYIIQLLDDVSDMFGQIPLIGTSGVQAEDRVTYMTIDEFPMFYLMNIDRQSRFMLKSKWEVCLTGSYGNETMKNRYLYHHGFVFVFRFCRDITNPDRWLLYKTDRIATNRTDCNTEDKCREVAQASGLSVDSEQNITTYQPIFEKIYVHHISTDFRTKFDTQGIDTGIILHEIRDTVMSRTWSEEFKCALRNEFKNPRVPSIDEVNKIKDTNGTGVLVVDTVSVATTAGTGGDGVAVMKLEINIDEDTDNGNSNLDIAVSKLGE